MKRPREAAEREPGGPSPKRLRPVEPRRDGGEGELAALREALEHALASHNNRGKAQLCDCSLCRMIHKALKPGAGRDYANRIREECIHVVEWKATELSRLERPPAAVQALRDVADLLRVLTLPR